MKKIILATFILCTFLTGYSQTEKGKKMIGGFISFYGSNTTNERDTSYKVETDQLNFQFKPEFGFFLKDNFAIGAQLIFGYSSQKNKYFSLVSNPIEYNNNTSITSYGIGIYARHYKKITEKFYYLFNGDMSYTYEIDKSESQGTENVNTPKNKYSVTLSPGLTYFMTPSLGIQTTFGNLYYEYSTATDKILSSDNHQNEHRYGVDINLSSFYLGMNYYF